MATWSALYVRAASILRKVGLRALPALRDILDCLLHPPAIAILVPWEPTLHSLKPVLV